MKLVTLLRRCQNYLAHSDARDGSDWFCLHNTILSVPRLSAAQRSHAHKLLWQLDQIAQTAYPRACAERQELRFDLLSTLIEYEIAEIEWMRAHFTEIVATTIRNRSTVLASNVETNNTMLKVLTR